VPIDEHNLSYMSATRAQKALFLNEDVERFLSLQGVGKWSSYAVAAGDNGLPEVMDVPQAQAAVQHIRERLAALRPGIGGRCDVATADIEAHAAEGGMFQVSDLLKCPMLGCELPFRRPRTQAFDVWHRPSHLPSEGILCPYCTGGTLFIDLL